MRRLSNKNCLYGGCERWERAMQAGLKFPECERCGFDEEEAKRRADIPLTMGKDGLQRKLIPKKPKEG